VKLVVDASVAVKWFLRRQEEGDLEQAMSIARLIDAAETELLAPCHWLAEVTSVVARLEPAVAESAVVVLRDMRATVIDSLPALLRSVELARTLNHHLFDTLYHAVALEHGATLVTADERYFTKAAAMGGITLLREHRD
jgi:predicted nucleic acid-binding protein